MNQLSQIKFGFDGRKFTVISNLKIMWKQRKARDFFEKEKIDDTKTLDHIPKDYIPNKTIQEFLYRLAQYEAWVLKNLLGDNYAVRVAAVNVKVIFRKNDVEPKAYFGDLYVVQNVKNESISFKLYSPKDNKFIWSIDNLPNLSGYVELQCNTHILQVGDSVYTFKFPRKKERLFFRDYLHQLLLVEKSKGERNQ